MRFRENLTKTPEMTPAHARNGYLLPVIAAGAAGR
jgi:hypothetical protein